MLHVPENRDRAPKSWVTCGPAVISLQAWEALLFYFSWKCGYGAGALIKLTTVGVAHHYRGKRLRERGVKKERKKKEREKDGIQEVYILWVSLICYIMPQTCLRKHTLAWTTHSNCTLTSSHPLPSHLFLFLTFTASSLLPFSFLFHSPMRPSGDF